MYIATVPNRNSPPAILLRESFRENGKVRNRTIANLSHWPAARIEAFRRLLGGEFDQAADLSQGPQLGRVFGLLLALKQTADALGLGAALGHSGPAKLAFVPGAGAGCPSGLTLVGGALGGGSGGRRGAGFRRVRRG